MSDPVQPTNPGFESLSAQELATAILAKALIGFATQGGRNHHNHAMDALLSAYASLADHHSCCTELYGKALLAIGQELIDLAASRTTTLH